MILFRPVSECLSSGTVATNTGTKGNNPQRASRLQPTSRFTVPLRCLRIKELISLFFVPPTSPMHHHPAGRKYLFTNSCMCDFGIERNQKPRDPVRKRRSLLILALPCNGLGLPTTNKKKRTSWVVETLHEGYHFLQRARMQQGRLTPR